MLGIGMSCAVTALPILVLLMEKLAILRTPLGQRILRYASLDDIAIWAVLAVILAQWDRIGKQALFLAAFGLAAWGLRRLMRAVSERDRWYIAVVWLALASLGADWCGLHFMIGAFLAGAVLDAHWFDQRRMDLLRDNVLLVLMPVFFLSTGLRTQWGVGGAHGVRGGGAVPGGRGGRQAARRRPGRPAAGLVARRVAGHRPAAADQGADHDHLFQRAAGQGRSSAPTPSPRCC
jgi:Kef-type K+ transport system membrane component KefB